MRLPRNLLRYLLGFLFLIVLLGHTGRLYTIPLLSHQDAFFYDVRVRMTMPGGVDERIVIVDLDEKSLGEVGRWPWSRAVMAELVTKLSDEYFVSMIGFDVVFAEPDDSSGLKTLERLGKTGFKEVAGFRETLNRMRDQLDYDARFADALDGRQVVLGYYFSNLENASKSGALPRPAVPPEVFRGQSHLLTRWAGYGANLPQLQTRAASGGHFNPLIDFDGVSRRVLMLVEHEGQYYETLSLAMIRLLLGGSELKPGFAETSSEDYAALEWLDIDSPRGVLRVPVDGHAAAMIPFRGGKDSFRYISAADVLKGRAPVDDLAGKIVLVGTTAPGLLDLRSTPVGSVYPGVEVHANMIAGMIDGSIKSRPSYLLGAESAMVLVFGLLLTLLLPRLSPARTTSLALAVLGVAWGIVYLLWEAGLVMPVAATIWLIGGLYALNMAWGFFIESRVKRQFASLFGQYVPPELVDEMAKDPERYSMEGRNQELTVLFSDVRSFTTLSEGLNPHELTQLMNEYLGAMTNLIREHLGTLDKYIGDAIMAFWGAPVDDPDHARNAVLAALHMQKALRTLDEPFKARGWPPLQIGVGVNTGVMTVGDMGSPVRKAYTVMGDAVNLGSRLEGITKQYGVGIIVGERTKELVGDVLFREIDRVRVKGKDKPVVIYEPLGLDSELSAETKAERVLWESVLTAYRAQDWPAAERGLESLRRDKPESMLYDLYATRIEYLRATPPGDGWDGVTKFETK
jgi:adenylate cyclase